LINPLDKRFRGSSGMKVLVLGASGMLGNALLRFFAGSDGYSVVGTVRSEEALRHLPRDLREHVIAGVDVEETASLESLFSSVRPNVVVNCIGVVKQLADSEDPLVAIPINSLLPHRLARLCRITGARLIQISTDCVFRGIQGMYREEDIPDVQDLYGRSKLLGEVDQPHAMTLRTSLIGHELAGTRSLVGWFLAQEGSVKGYEHAIFSGMPTVELARVMRDFIFPHPELHGVYHVAARPISKYDLLRLVADIYGKQIRIIPDRELVIDRSLNGERFCSATGYVAPDWPELIRRMHAFQ
jgi:dTDP-4-dehydrorhamnose reductase